MTNLVHQLQHQPQSRDGLRVLSASRMKTFTSCHRKYWYNYVEQHPYIKNMGQIRGTSVHKSVEEKFRDIKSGNVQNVDPLLVYDDTFGKEMSNSPGTVFVRSEYDLGMKMVRLYDFQGRIPAQVEQEFILPFPDSENPICMIHGFMDQVYSWGLVDMKTTYAKPKLGVLGYDLQFILYNWAYTQLYGEKPQAVIWQHLRTGEDIIADVQGEEKLRYTIRAVQELLETLKITEWHKEAVGEIPIELFERNPGTACMMCSYRVPCLGRED